jgi:hypothetical protein
MIRQDRPAAQARADKLQDIFDARPISARFHDPLQRRTVENEFATAAGRYSTRREVVADVVRAAGNYVINHAHGPHPEDRELAARYWEILGVVAAQWHEALETADRVVARARGGWAR